MNRTALTKTQVSGLRNSWRAVQALLIAAIALTWRPAFAYGARHHSVYFGLIPASVVYTAITLVVILFGIQGALNGITGWILLNAPGGDLQSGDRP